MRANDSRRGNDDARVVTSRRVAKEMLERVRCVRVAVKVEMRFRLDWSWSPIQSTCSKRRYEMCVMTVRKGTSLRSQRWSPPWQETNSRFLAKIGMVELIGRESDANSSVLKWSK